MSDQHRSIAAVSSVPKWAREALAWPFDFDLVIHADVVDALCLRFDPDASFRPVAADGAGGVYGEFRDQAAADPVLAFVSSEGQAGVIADSLNMGMALVVAAPYWRDLAKFSAGGNLQEMRRVLKPLEADLEQDSPEAIELRPRLARYFSLRLPEDPALALHSAISEHATTFRVYDKDGGEYDPLFGRFKLEDNPLWNVHQAHR